MDIPAHSFEPSPAKGAAWALSDGAYEHQFTASTAEASVWLVDSAMRQLRQGIKASVTIHLHDRLLGVLWDATADVNAVFAAAGWPTLDGDILGLRITVIRILRDILITDDTPVDAPPPGMCDPHTYALVCR